MGGDDGGPVVVHVDKEGLGFAAAHFGVIGGGRERLHGHNYRVGVRARGGVDAQGTVVDFAALKLALREEVAALDHRTLVPTACPEVSVDSGSDAGHVGLAYGGDRFLFPAADVALLPVRNTTCECLAGLLLRRVRERLGPIPVRLDLTVEESPGQGATVVEERF